MATANDNSNDRFNDRFNAVKRQFSLFKNGIVSDALRAAGSPFAIVWGLNLPQLKEIAAATGHDAALARRLWDDRRTRESMLLAPMLLTPADLTATQAVEMIDGAPAPEVIDILCHTLLRHRPDAMTLAEEMAAAAAPMRRYAAMRLLPSQAHGAARARALQLALAEAQRRHPLTLQPALNLADSLSPDSIDSVDTADAHDPEGEKFS